MKKLVLLIGALGVVISCEKVPDGAGGNGARGYRVEHGMMVLGDQLENPYTVVNMEKALAVAYPTKAGTRLEPTHNYVRFLPENEQEAENVYNLGLDITDYPLDFEIVIDGDYYHDPAVHPEHITYLYACAPIGFDFGDVRYELLAPCFITEGAQTKGGPDGVDWDLVERVAYQITGNAGSAAGGGSGLGVAGSGGGPAAGLATKAWGEKAIPQGQITMYDPEYCDGKPFAVKGVKVRCAAFVKFASAYTDESGHYKMDKEFNMHPRYCLVFENKKGFAQGLNLILLKGSMSAIGYYPQTGVDVVIGPNADSNLYRRCAINNVVWDYYERCDEEDMSISRPPGDLRIWTITAMKSSFSPMARHGAITNYGPLKNLLGKWSVIVDFFLPDIMLGLNNAASYKEIYEAVTHELAHASHYSTVGNSYWTPYIEYVIKSFIKDGWNRYGKPENEHSGLCEVSETWAFAMSSVLKKEHYGGDVEPLGNEHWFRPQIYRNLFERGIGPHDVFRAMTSNATEMQDVWDNLLDTRGDDSEIINAAFSMYK